VSTNFDIFHVGRHNLRLSVFLLGLWILVRVFAVDLAFVCLNRSVNHTVPWSKLVIPGFITMNRVLVTTQLFKNVPVFSSISSIYCYSSVSYGQKMTTLFRQYIAMTVILNAGG